jgi:hypothetical protein
MDDYPAFLAALTAMESLSPPSVSTGGTLLVPFGTFRLSQTLHLKRGMILQGVSGAGWYSGSVLKPDDGVTAIIADTAVTSSHGGSGAWSVIRDLGLLAAGNTSLTAHAIQMFARTHVENFWIRGFGGNGVNIVANHQNGTNANNWSLANGRIDGCVGHGVYVDGADANAGVATQVDASENGGWGFWDSSFLGNCYVACHTAANVLGPYKTDNHNARNLLLNCYSEQGQPPSDLVDPTMVILGLHGAGFTTTSTHVWFGAAYNGGYVSPSLHCINTQLTPHIESALGAEDTSQTAFSCSATGVANTLLRLRYNLDAANFPGWWSWVLGNAVTQEALAFQTGVANTPLVRFRHGLLLQQTVPSPSKTSCRFTVGTAAPTTGTWGRGDRVYNSLPVPGGVEGWVCVTAGTPGTWKTFGAIGN